MNNLNLKRNQFAVSKAEFTTGIVLKNDGLYFKSGDNQNDIYTIFETFDLAKDFAIKEIQQNPEIECWIKNARLETVFFIDKNGERSFEKRKNKDFLNLPKNLTLFYVTGILSIIAGIIYAIVLINGNSAEDGLMGIYILFWLIPVLLVILIDRFLVKKFGNQKVNKVQFSFLGFIILLWIIRAIVNL